MYTECIYLYILLQELNKMCTFVPEKWGIKCIDNIRPPKTA